MPQFHSFPSPLSRRGKKKNKINQQSVFKSWIILPLFPRTTFFSTTESSEEEPTQESDLDSETTPGSGPAPAGRTKTLPLAFFLGGRTAPGLIVCLLDKPGRFVFPQGGRREKAEK